MTGDTISKTPFLVTGLPRTRSAWLASVLTDDGDRCCFHEPCGTFETYEGFRDWLVSPNDFHVGAADQAIGFVAARLIRDIQPRILVVERPFGEAAQSFERYMAGIKIDHVAVIEFMMNLQACLDELSGPLVYRIKYRDMGSPKCLKAALRWLVPGIDLEGVEAAMNVNIQADRDTVMARGAPHMWYLQ
jgi:hypothetical protein